MEGGYTGEDGLWYEDYTDYVMTGLLGLCGCADDKLVEDILSVIAVYHRASQVTHFYDTDLGAYHRTGSSAIYYDEVLTDEPRKYVELILHMLTNAGLLEHGTAVRGSWLTKEGEEVAEGVR